MPVAASLYLPAHSRVEPQNMASQEKTTHIPASGFSACGVWPAAFQVGAGVGGGGRPPPKPPGLAPKEAAGVPKAAPGCPAGVGGVAGCWPPKAEPKVVPWSAENHPERNISSPAYTQMHEEYFHRICGACMSPIHFMTKKTGIREAKKAAGDLQVPTQVLNRDGYAA